MENDEVVETYGDYLPRTETVLVGKQELQAEELCNVRRGVVIDRLVAETGEDGLLGGLRGLKDSSEDQALKRMAGTFADVFKRKIPDLICLVLDTEDNRALVVLEDPEIATHADGYEYCPGMWEWINKRVTGRQELFILKAAFRVNDFVGLVKNYLALAEKVMQGIATAGEERTDQTSP